MASRARAVLSNVSRARTSCLADVKGPPRHMGIETYIYSYLFYAIKIMVLILLSMIFNSLLSLA